MDANFVGYLFFGSCRGWAGVGLLRYSVDPDTAVPARLATKPFATSYLENVSTLAITASFNLAYPAIHLVAICSARVVFLCVQQPKDERRCQSLLSALKSGSELSALDR
jgi:hypothetical protein